MLQQQQQLIASEVVTREQVAEALQSREGKRGRLLLALLTMGDVNADLILQTLARIYKVPYLDISGFQPNETLLQTCSEQLCIDHKFVPIDSQGGEIIIATGEPMDFANLDAIQFKLGLRVKPVFARPDVIEQKIREFYQGDAAFDAAMEGLSDDDSFSAAGDEKEQVSLDDLKRGAEDSPIIKLVNGIIVQAMKMGSSDIHIEAGEKSTLVRLRVDGRLRPALQFPVRAHPLVASRIKIMSKLDISNTRTPQDGRARIKLWGKSYDMRISTLPSMHGEKVVMRILDKSGLSLNLDLLGFEKKADARVRECISRPTGAVLVTGPTGSGKTTTLYSFLHHIKDEETNLVTVEDPVEFQIKGINQVQINAKAGMTFAAALRSILRQDPDVVMVGEIRDEETAEIALHAAQTGHLVLSTLHTNDAPSTITRLIDMGIESTMLSSSLNLVVAQRLSRRLCPHCKKRARPDEALIERFDIPEEVHFYEPVGCKECMQIGYKGRIGMHEVLYVNDRMRELISRSAPDRELMQAAREEGMFTLFEDGLNKALAGITSLEEVMRNATPPEGFRLRDRLDGEGKLISLGEMKKQREQVRSAGAKLSGKKRVMIVDDSRSIRSLVKFVLQSDGYDVIEAEDGEQGWEIIQRLGDSLSLVLTDYEMPNMSGMELVGKVREQSKYDGIALVMLTSRKEEEDEVSSLDSGADDYICKPVEPMKLQARVRKMLGMYDRISSAVH
ncbi:MAG: ATPase, T2SS/T4P/T4SS family [Mariprofundaceae bacterium]|nr:ATPase, T2SS/T4P/T4SS family [Mariprofundaceae bacterium]